MKNYTGEQIRNIGMGSHSGAGKTSLVEAMLFTMGATTRLGSVEQGNTVSDYNEDEIERQISISTSLLHGEWNKHKINIVDTPGFFDFFGDVISGLRSIENVMLLVSAASGVEVGTEQVWELSEKYEKPVTFIINKMDRENVNFDALIASMRERLGHNLLPVQIPVETGHNFYKLIDVFKMKMLTFPQDKSGKPSVEEIPDDLKGKAEELRTQLIEAVAESDDALLEKFFDAGELTPEEFQDGFKKAYLNRKIFPIFCTSSTHNVGISNLLDFIVEFAPSPAHMPPLKSIEGKERKPTDNEPLTAFIFKTVSEAHVGELSLVRVFSGILESGSEVLNATQGTSERVGQIFDLSGKNKQNVDELHAGDIGALVKLKGTHTGDTLNSKNQPFQLPKLDLPEPLITLAVQPKSKGDESKISTGFHSLHEEDPTFVTRFDPELKQSIIAGQGELHIDIIVKRLKQKFGVEVNLKDPKIPYRETIKTKADAKYRHKKQSGGAGQFAEVWMRIEPKPRGEGVEFTNSLVGQNVDRVYVTSVEKGVNAACEEGVLAGYHVVDLLVDFYDGKMHPVDSSDIAFQIAGKAAFKEGFMQAKPILLEPIYDIEVKVPEEFMGDVMGDISSKRGKISGMESGGSFQIIKAKVPLAELHKYSTTLRSMTQGRGIFTQRFSHYEELPHEMAQKVIERAKKEKEEE
ncbi:MAG: elongation factor G [Calditrichaeota bacterium]|nr:elongation factor G [Calditrichota bacterium]RQV93138.1 MAG: elongation factor G [bacterium]RQW04495.1 MAG: elongation factor G [Calditrichota bacterium]